MSAFQKNQLLVHEVYGECVALREWNEKETICLVTSSRRRQILMNCLLKPVLGAGPNDNCICIIDEKDVNALEGKSQ